MGRIELRLPTEPIRVQQSNKAAWNDGRSAERADFFTVGYTGQRLDQLMAQLKSAGIGSVVDIRHNAVSMYRPELSKSNFQRAVEAEGMRYYHARQLGVPRDVRALAIGELNRESIWKWYDKNVVETFVGKNLNWFFNALEHPVALMCVEIDPTACHRHRLFQALEEHRLQGFDL